MAKRTKAPPCTMDRLTDTNTYVLAREFGKGQVVERFESVSIPHVRRLMEAGAIERVGKQSWRMSAAGLEHLLEQQRRYPMLYEDTYSRSFGRWP